MSSEVSRPEVASRRVSVGTAWLVLAAVMGMLAAMFWSAKMFSICLDDTGGGPVGDSVQGRFCGDWGEWPGMPGALLFLALAVVGGLAAALLLHMSRGRTHVGVMVLALLAPAVLPTAAFLVVLNAPTACSADKQAPYSAWEAQLRKQRSVEPPYDCEVS